MHARGNHTPIVNESENGIDGESTGQGSPPIAEKPVQGKFTLRLDCDRLLKPDITRPRIYISKSADEAARYLQLSSLVMVPTLNRIKIKLFHTCGPVELEEGSCLTALQSVGNWLVEQYQTVGKTAQFEKRTYDHTEDWADPDAILEVFID